MSSMQQLVPPPEIVSQFYETLEHRYVKRFKALLKTWPHIYRQQSKNCHNAYYYLAINQDAMWAWELLVACEQNARKPLYMKCSRKSECFAVHYAAMNGNIDFLSRIKVLNKNAWYLKTKSHENILHVAARFGQFECARYIMHTCPSFCTQKDSYGWLPLNSAIEARQLPIIELLLTVNMDVSKCDISHHGNVLRKLDVTCMKLILQKFPQTARELETDGFSVLCTAATVETVQYLLAHKPELISVVDDFGDTLLHNFVRNNGIMYVTTLLDMGPELIMKTNQSNETALHYAVKYRNDRAMEAIIARCPSFNYSDKNNNTLLHLIAASNSDRTVIDVYNHNPSNMFVENSLGFTPFAIAIKCSYNKHIHDFFESVSELWFIIDTYCRCQVCVCTLRIKVIEQCTDLQLLPELNDIIFDYIFFQIREDNIFFSRTKTCKKNSHMHEESIKRDVQKKK